MAVKKTAKKAARKTTRKPAKKAKKKAGRKLEVYTLGKDAPKKRFFVLANGRPVKHVVELAEVLEDLEDHIFNHHVNKQRNDFHNWVKDVFKDVELAKKMLGVSDKKQLQLVIYKHVVNKAMKG